MADSKFIINFDMFRLSSEFTSQNVGYFYFRTRRTRVFDKILCTTHVKNVLYNPPYLDGVMHICCIRKSKVSSQMYSTRLMGYACFNNIMDKHISYFLLFLFHKGFHRNTVNCLKIATLLRNLENVQ